MIRWIITYMQSDKQIDRVLDGLMYQQMGWREVTTDIQTFRQYINKHINTQKPKRNT